MSLNDRGQLIPAKTNVRQFLREHWLEDKDVDALPHEVRNKLMYATLAFRTISPDDHHINVGAALVTRRPGDVPPGGKMCHVELLLPVGVRESHPGGGAKAAGDKFRVKLVAASVIKKYWKRKEEQPDGTMKDIFEPGCVHCKLVDGAEYYNKYVHREFQVKRSQIKRALEFCLLNNGQPFNHPGYYLNLFIPGGYGVRRFHERLMVEPRPYFCTEFVVCAMQAMCSEPAASLAQDNVYRGTHFLSSRTPNNWMNVINRENPAKSNPNRLFRVLESAQGIGVHESDMKMDTLSLGV